MSQKGFSSAVSTDAQDTPDQTREWGGQRWGEGGPKLRDQRAEKVKAWTAPSTCLALQSLALEGKEENGAQVEKQEAGPVLLSHASAHALAARGRGENVASKGGDGTWRLESCPELVDIKIQGRDLERDCAWTRLLMAVQIGQSGRIRSPISFSC